MCLVLRLTIICCILLFLISCESKSNDDYATTDIRQYPSLLSKWQPTGLVDHFPSSIPARAEEAKIFGTRPGAFQGSMLQLRLQLPLNEIFEIENNLRVPTTQRFGTDHNTDQAWREKDFKTPIDYTGTGGAFDASFDLFVLYAKKSGSSDSPWNHGASKGLAISPKHQVVVYWCEIW